MIITLSIALTPATLAGLAASLIIGLSLGLIGGGGSILTVPVLVYLFGVEPVMATAYSLFIVGLTSAVGVFPKYKEGLVDVRTGLIFGAPSIATVFLTRQWLVPNIPNTIWQINDFVLTKSVMLMLLFAILMVAASVSMIRDPKTTSTQSELSFNYPLIVLEGAIVGVLTGLVGAGGGFLIIPALVLLTKLPMKKAVGTSLLIIAAKSLIGFTSDASQQTMDWTLLLSITLMAVAGLFAGNALSKKIEGGKLKKGFGWFVLIMGVYIILKETLGKHA
ncbi:MAG: sulfite exporter TauE/SafE family protein [Sphingomonadales bacterium]|nr:sulfite exporter TauE/SafE family protein [Sphingomonadales bacterium]